MVEKGTPPWLRRIPAYPIALLGPDIGYHPGQLRTRCVDGVF